MLMVRTDSIRGGTQTKITVETWGTTERKGSQSDARWEKQGELVGKQFGEQHGKEAAQTSELGNP